MTRTRRSIIRAVSAATATAVGAGAVGASSHEEAGWDDPIESAQLRTTNQGCASGSDDDSTVSRSGSVVKLAGTITASTPCHEAVFESIDLDGDTLVVTLGTEPEDVDLCVDCIGAIEYAGRIELSEPSAVEDVEVRHGDESNPGDDVVVDSGIRTTAQSCSSGGVSLQGTNESPPIRDDTVRFGGSMQTPNPCHEAVIDSISLDGDTLVVTVASEWPDDVDACIMCLGRIEFEGWVELSDPSAVDAVRVRTVDPWA